MPRKPLGTRPMTQTERNARSKQQRRDELLGQINLISEEARTWRNRMRQDHPGATDTDIGNAFDQILQHLHTVHSLILNKEQP